MFIYSLITDWKWQTYLKLKKEKSIDRYLVLSKILSLKRKLNLCISTILRKLMWLTLSNVSFVYEAWQHMTIINAKVVMRSKHISGNHSCIATPVLLEIRPVKHTHTLTDSSYSCDIVNLLLKKTAEFLPVMNVNHSLCIGIAKVWLMRWAVMDLGCRSKVKLVAIYKSTDTCQLTVDTW